MFCLKGASWWEEGKLPSPHFRERIQTPHSSTAYLRRAMLTGPDWHALPGTNFVGNLRVAILPGVASVVTREMVLEKKSLWNAE